MSYVMVPVPAEHVLDVMRWVLFRTPEEDGVNDMRDRARLSTFMADATDVTRSILARVARAAVNDDPLRLSDVADDLGTSPSADQAGERQFAEEVGRVFEQFGIARMAGRLLGWLLICDPPPTEC